MALRALLVLWSVVLSALLSTPLMAETRTYVYDSRGRLVTAIAPAYTASYAYDNADNRVNVQVVSAHRYWRVRTSQTGIAGNYFGVAELELHATIGGADLTAGRSSFASATHAAGYEAYRAINDNLADFWTTGANSPPAGGHWLATDLVTPSDVKEVRITVRPDGYREDPLNLYVEFSDDGGTWFTAWSKAAIPTWSAGETRTFN